MLPRPFPALPPEHNVPAFPPRLPHQEHGDDEARHGHATEAPTAVEDFLSPPAARRLDAALLALLLAGGTWLFLNAAGRLDYQWNWSVVWQYLLRHDAQQVAQGAGGWVPGTLTQGLLVTVRLGVWSTLLALCIGTGMGLLRASPHLFRRMVARTYVEGVRNLPPLVLVFIFHFFVSSQFAPLLAGLFAPVADGVADMLPPQLYLSVQDWLMRASSLLLAPPGQLPVFLSGVLVLGLYEGAYITEIVRAGLEGVGRGQWEASASTGLTRRQQLRHVILPQAFRLIVPPLAGQFISTIKDSAILSVISIRELTFQGMELMAATYLTFEIWLTVAALYLMLTFSCSLAARHVERRLRRAI
ncbi:amino acid ABC transporter permease [Nitratidesulfovibrio liaohensis]|uniref:amino acid ABC transporter permease n=1 Tax=Nitratidesulfovibrio liaohensis TaxID=2604158 RepID=UPI0014237887|nr:amino acid ABC transporter permease [Nitratidesulfovibrio liaohensis]NHZ46522.1 amino acid ABC transporter permease [Nitratidesulfovibrio liaohensis]